MKSTTTWLVIVAVCSAAFFALGALLVDGPVAVVTRAATATAPTDDTARSDDATAETVFDTAAAPTAVAEVAGIRSEFSRAAATYQLAAAANVEQLRRYLFDAQAIESKEERALISDVLLFRYSELDAQGAFEFLLENDFELKPSYLNRLFVRWARLDLDAAIDAARGLTLPRERQPANDGILAAHAAAGPARLAEITERLTAGANAGLNPNSVLRLANTDPVTAIRQAAQLPPDIAASVAATIGQSWGMRDPEAAYRHAKTLDGTPLHTYVMDGLFNAWITTNPTRVVEILDSGVPPDERVYIIRSGVSRMARARPREAFDLIRGMQDPIARDAAARDALQLWAQQDAPAAAAALATFETRDRNALGMAVGHQYARADPDGAVAWAIEYDKGHGETWRNTLSEVARRDPQRSFEIAARTAESDRQRAYTIAVSSMAQLDTSVATRYWQQLPESVKPEGAWYVVLEWVKRDTDGAASWLLGMPGGAARDRGLQALLNDGTIEPWDYPRLVNAITEPRQRDSRAAQRVNEMLREGDRLGAQNLLGQLDLSTEMTERLRRQIDDSQ